MNELLLAALRYRHMGFSVIPLSPGEKIPPKDFQVIKYRSEFASDEEIKAWWNDNPRYNVGIITGSLSNLFVIDVDTQEGWDAIESYLPSNLETPTAQTPRGGKHLYFLHDADFTIGANLVPGIDVRGEGGYVVAAPSINGNGKKYAWMIDPDVPRLALNNKIKNLLIGRVSNRKQKKDVTNETPVTNVTLSFTEGCRDENLFSVAHALYKGGMSYENSLKCLEIIASQCQPPFPLKDARVKLDSAVQRISRRERNITGEVREWVLVTSGHFSVTMAYNELNLLQKEEKTACRVALLRMVKDGEIERIKGKHGWYRLVDKTCEVIDYLSEPEAPLDIQLPLGIHELVEIMPGNIIIIAGEPNAGKTSFLFNFVKMNMHKYDITYFNSEMASEELRKRLLKIPDVPLDGWRWTVKGNAENFADHIIPGRGNINIIDYLEIYKDFYEAGGYINDIYRKLDGAIAVIAMQKNPGVNVAVGGFRTLEKARLALALSHGRIDIVKAKNWAAAENPNGKYCEFKIIQGGHMYATSGWIRDKK